MTVVEQVILLCCDTGDLVEGICQKIDRLVIANVVRMEECLFPCVDGRYGP